MSQKLFNLPIISHDLIREEAIYQIANSIEYLDQCCNEIFDRIETSMDNASKKIRTYDDRISLINLKISKIKGSKKAIQICSSAKYPLESNEPEQMDENKHLYQNKTSFDMKHKLHKYLTPYTPLDELSFKDKFQEFYAESVFKYNSIDLKNKETELGNILSDNIESITSLLLFNTAQHPYKDQELRDPLEDLDFKKLKKSNLLDEYKSEIDKAPESILQGEQIQTMKRENITFKPKLGDVPDFDVPEFLSELSGVADIYYKQELPSIAPSNLITDDLTDILPDIVQENDVLPTEITETSEQTSGNTVAAVPPPPPPPPMLMDNLQTPVSSAPPPPPPPPPMLMDNLQTPVSSAPPPPPPPFQSASNEDEEPLASSPPPIEEPKKEAADGISSLLDEIRNFGGNKAKRKLRGIENRKQDVQKQEDPSNLSMADMIKSAIMKRRQFMDGSNDKKNVESKPPVNEPMDTPQLMPNKELDRISMMIPPPPITTNDDSDNSEWGD